MRTRYPSPANRRLRALAAATLQRPASTSTGSAGSADYTPPTQEQRDALARDGFVILRSLLGAGELAALRAAGDRLLEPESDGDRYSASAELLTPESLDAVGSVREPQPCWLPCPSSQPGPSRRRAWRS